jgi:hypothetical protein
MIKALLTVLAALVQWLERRERKQRVEAQQREVDELQQDPAGWFHGRFNGGVQHTDAMRDNAEQTTSTKPAEPDNNAGRRDHAGPGGH